MVKSPVAIVFIENIDKATDDFVAYLNNSIFKYAFFDIQTV
jgi:hypothetical protein